MDPRGRPNSIPVAALADSAVVKTKYTFPYEYDNKICTVRSHGCSRGRLPELGGGKNASILVQWNSTSWLLRTSQLKGGPCLVSSCHSRIFIHVILRRFQKLRHWHWGWHAHHTRSCLRRASRNLNILNYRAEIREWRDF